MNVHIVVKGDTLWKIARQYGISFEELKKVNAHLANPDYIVPGMKIFLPEGKGTKHPEKHGGKEKHPLPQEKHPLPHEKHPQHNEKPVKPPQQKPMPSPPPKPVPMPPPPKPVPMPPPPKPTPKPTPKPEVKPQPAPKPEVKPQPMPPPPPPIPEVKPIPKPESPNCEAPPPPPLPPVQQQPMVHPMFIGIPCGWMPIYDADCYPCAHPMQQPMHYPMAPPMMPQVPVQPPMWNMQPENEECTDESPIMAGQGPGLSPNHCDSMKTWESPNVQTPDIESDTFDLSPPAYCPPEQGYIPQQMPQQGYPQQYPNNQQVPMQGIQAAHHPQYMHLCSSCGSNLTPTPYYGMPMMGVHPFYGGYPQMAYPQQGYYGQNQTGSY